MARLFDRVQLNKPTLNKFDLSHERKMSLDMGKLIPIVVQDVLPGDKFRVKSEIMLRMSPMLAPIMHRVNVFTHYFFVPNRLVWSEWEDFITGGRLGVTLPVAPYVDTTVADDNVTSGVGSLWDYMGLPTLPLGGVTQNTKVSVLPFRAYQLIYDEYYRDQNLEAKVTEFASFKSSGPQIGGIWAGILDQLRTRAWEKDYFTSALPFAQRGAVTQVPLSNTPIGNGTQAFRADTGALFPAGEDVVIGAAGQLVGSVTGAMNLAPTGHGINVNELRRSLRLQEWLEKNARGGARYVEQILQHFGVTSKDARLQRPEYLGGGKAPVVISEVLSNYQVAGGNPQGTMAGHGVSFGTTNGFTRRFDEHGYVIGIMSVLPKTAYQQGIPRHFTRFDKFDYPWPEFAQIGEQEVLNKELYYSGITLPDGTFGYQSRYAECKYGCSSVHGEMKGTLAFWHMGRIFTSLPVLNTAFVTSDPTTRIFAVTAGSNNKLYCQLFNKVDALRPLPYFGTPTL